MRSLQIAAAIAALLVPALACAANIEKLAKADWILVSSPHFEIVTDLDEQDGRRLLQDLEVFRHFSTAIMNLKSLQGVAPLKILAVGDDSDFEKLDLPKNWGGVFSLNYHGYAAIAKVSNYERGMTVASAARATLLHEYLHFLMRLTEQTEAFPVWYDEGMAEYWSTFNFDGAKIRIGNPEDNNGRRADVFHPNGSFAFDSEALFNAAHLPSGSTADDRVAMRHFYAQAFFAVHYLYSTPQLRTSLAAYKSYINLGYEQRLAFERAFGVSYADFNRAAIYYMRRHFGMMVFAVKSDQALFEAKDARVAKLDMPGFYRQLAGIVPMFGAFDRATAQAVLEKTVELNPADGEARAQLLTSGLAPRPGELADQLRTLDRNHPLLHTYEGDLLRAKANSMRMAGDAHWIDLMKQARDEYRRAIAIAPTLPMPYRGLGESYAFLPASEPLSEGAVGLDTAAIYDRSADTFAALALLYIRMDKPFDALPALRSTVAFSTDKKHSPYALILDNMELLNEASRVNGKPSADGLAYDSGTIYAGPTAHGKPDGVGRMTRANGSYYVGAFAAGIMQGQGKLVSASGAEYEGEFRDGIARGKGKLRRPEQEESYVGGVDYGLPKGNGVEIRHGEQFEGDFWYGRKHGNGSYSTVDKTVLLQGRWVDDRYMWPEKDGVKFVGGIDAKGRRDGEGVCSTSEPARLQACAYKGGERQNGALGTGRAVK
jgi:hypothetical protein